MGHAVATDPSAAVHDDDGRTRLGSLRDTGVERQSSFARPGVLDIAPDFDIDGRAGDTCG